LTKKELLEGGWIDQYVLGLTTEAENREVERLAHLYPEVQEEINKARERLCSSFNRNLTRPAMRHAFLTRRNLKLVSALAVIGALVAIGLMWRENTFLARDYRTQCDNLAREKALNRALAARQRLAGEAAQFVNAENTRRIQLRGCEDTPEAEVVVYKCVLSGKMMMRVIELPQPPEGGHFEIWARGPGTDKPVGRLIPPIHYDSLYVLDTALNSTALAITAVDPARKSREPVCLAAIGAR
jgi:hypothetical protein